MAFEQRYNTSIALKGPLQLDLPVLHVTKSVEPTTQALPVNDSPTQSSDISDQTTFVATLRRQEQEAEDALNQRIEKLCQDLWASPTSMKRRLLASRAATCLRSNSLLRQFVPTPPLPQIQHLRGGGFNHITSITLPSSYTEAHRNLILRVPREDKSRPDQQVATLEYVRKRTSIPVATIEAADFTCNNAVRKPYVIQRRIAGRDLDSVWDDLSHPQRRVIAKEIGYLIRALLSVESLVAGTIQASTRGSHTSAEVPDIVQFRLTDALGNPIEALDSDTILGTSTSSRETTLNFFEYYLSRWKNFALTQGLGKIGSEVALYDDILKVVREMDNLGLFRPDLYCLCHLDLYPRNVMVEFDPEDSIQVTGILDWDEAVFAPKPVNCQPPGWLWGYDKDTQPEKRLLPWPYELEGLNSTPSTPEQQELKLIFEECAGPDYRRLAYNKSSRLIRILYRLATLGLTASRHRTAAETIVKEWETLRPALINLHTQD